MKFEILILLICFFSCDENKKTSVSAVPTQRNGRSLNMTDPKYIDTRPSISANGSQVAFVSYRDGLTARVFGLTIGDTGPVGQPTQLIKDKGLLDSEDGVVVSPDGQWILVKGYKNQKTVLYLSSFDGSKTQLVETPVLGSFGFFADSSLFYYQTPQQGGGSQIKLGQTKIISASAISTVGMTADSCEHLTASQVSTPNSYQLLCVKAGSFGSQKSLLLFSFTSWTAVSTGTTQTSIVQSLAYGGLSLLKQSIVGYNSATQSSAYPITPLGGRVLGEDLAKFPTFFGTHEGFTASLQKDAKITPFSLGALQAESFASNNAGDFLVLAVQVPVVCKPTDNVSYYSVLKKFDSTGADKGYMIPSFASASSIGTTGDLCADHTSAPGQYPKLDVGITQVKMAGLNATATHYRLVYVSDITRDQEVWLLDVKNGAATIYSASQNASP